MGKKKTNNEDIIRERCPFPCFMLPFYDIAFKTRFEAKLAYKKLLRN